MWYRHDRQQMTRFLTFKGERHAGVLDGLRLAVSHCKVEHIVHVHDTRLHRQASASALRLQKSFSRSSSASEDDLSRGRHASWQELPPELVALIFQRASARERKLCESSLL